MGRKNNKKNRAKAKAAGRSVGKALIPAGTFANVGGGLGGNLGKTVGNLVGLGDIGGALGSLAGGTLGNLFAGITGFGDYRVRNNSLLQTGGRLPAGQPIPSFGTRGHGITVMHREYIKDIVVPASPTAFSVEAFDLNPGSTTLFPWLAPLAENFQQYRFRGMVVEFVSTSGDISGGSSLGSVTLATDYNVLAPVFPDKVHMDNSEYACSGKPSCSQVHSIECAPNATASKLLYIRNANTEAAEGSSDARLYDLGKFQVATKGLPGSTGEVLGELWVSYEVELYKPVIVDAVAGSFRAQCSIGVSIASTFGTSPVESGTSASATGNALTFSRPGEYLVAFSMVGTGLVYPVVGGTATKALIDRTGTALIEMVTYVVDVEDGDTITYDSSGSTSLTLSNIRIAPYRYSYGAEGLATARRRGAYHPGTVVEDWCDLV